MARLSDDYFLALAESKRYQGRSRSFSGALIYPHIHKIKEIIDRHGCVTVLDYGCGKGVQYEHPIPEIDGRLLEDYWGVKVRKYDPAWKPFSQKPNGLYDLVIVTHALGCVPKRDLSTIIRRLYGYAGAALYVGEIIGPVRKKVFSNTAAMPFGFKPEDWMRVLRKSGTKVEVTLGTKTNDTRDDPMSWWQSTCGSEFTPVDGKMPVLSSMTWEPAVA